MTDDTAPEERKLKRRERRFVLEYLLDLNGAAAVRRMGFTGERPDLASYKLRQRPAVQRAIANALAEREKRTKISADYVLRKLRQTVERCSQSEPVRDKLGRPVFIEGPNGQTVALYHYNVQGVTASLSLLMDHLGMKKTRVEHTTKGGAAMPGPVMYVIAREEAKLIGHELDQKV